MRFKSLSISLFIYFSIIVSCDKENHEPDYREKYTGNFKFTIKYHYWTCTEVFNDSIHVPCEKNEYFEKRNYLNGQYKRRCLFGVSIL